MQFDSDHKLVNRIKPFALLYKTLRIQSEKTFESCKMFCSNIKIRTLGSAKKKEKQQLAHLKQVLYF